MEELVIDSTDSTRETFTYSCVACTVSFVFFLFSRCFFRDFFGISLPCPSGAGSLVATRCASSRS
jgi:hypothetical protein